MSVLTGDMPRVFTANRLFGSIVNLEKVFFPNKGNDNSLGSGIRSSSKVTAFPEPNCIVEILLLMSVEDVNRYGAGCNSRFSLTRFASLSRFVIPMYTTS